MARRFRVRHRTRYRFSRPVFLEPHILRLCPRGEVDQRLLEFALDLDPPPAGLAQGLDAEGNGAAWAWFDGLTETLAIESRFTAEARRDNPFDFILTAAETLPAVYPPELVAPLAPCRRSAGTRTVASLAEELVAQGPGTLDFLQRLCSRLYETIQVELRPAGDPWPAARTLAEGQGACRDLAVLFIEACRCQGLAARYVSGYQAGDPETPERHLHAWAEVYLPGGGWRGYDPTHGLAVGDGHLALAASALPSGAAPVCGTFRGSGVGTTMDYQVEIESEPL